MLIPITCATYFAPPQYLTNKAFYLSDVRWSSFRDRRWWPDFMTCFGVISLRLKQRTDARWVPSSNCVGFACHESWKRPKFGNNARKNLRQLIQAQSWRVNGPKQSQALHGPNRRQCRDASNNVSSKWRTRVGKSTKGAGNGVQVFRF